ncbi:MAG: hypothetical protein Q9208_005555 [Pyrenodesmia sp. 3 TL-2023]
MAESSTSASKRQEPCTCNGCRLYRTSLLSYPPKIYTPASEYRIHHYRDKDYERLFAHCYAIKTLHSLLESRVHAMAGGEIGRDDAVKDGVGEIWRKVVGELRAKAEGWKKETQAIEEDAWDSYADQGED